MNSVAGVTRGWGDSDEAWESRKEGYAQGSCDRARIEAEKSGSNSSGK